VEDPRVDVLSQSYYGRRDSGFNHILAREAAENNVAVEINVGYLLSNHNHRRGKILAQFREISKLKFKYNFPLIITSGARSVYDLRSPRDLMELAACFGMDKETACNALSKVPEDIIYQGQIRNQLILPGVRLLE
ncbi:MAG: RNase P subunit p30 family protein, partial [Methanobacteriaceae archaeon]|nr:RNase P subunit p30 family protein [Methanobacteriaceae archaeon]